MKCFYYMLRDSKVGRREERKERWKGRGEGKEKKKKE